MVRQTGCEMREKFLRARVQPVNVFDDQGKRPGFARPEEQIAEEIEGPCLELRSRLAIEEFLRRGHPEEVGEQDGPVVSVESQQLKPLGDTRPDLLAAHPLGENQTPSDELQDGTVGHGAAVRHAGGFELQESEPFVTAQELVQQAGLADARVTFEQRDGALAGGGPLVGLCEALDLALTADQRREPALLRDF